MRGTGSVIEDAYRMTAMLDSDDKCMLQLLVDAYDGSIER